MVAESQPATPSDGSLGRVDDSLAAIEKVEAGISPAATPPPQSHNQNQLDGGLRAWLQVVGGWCIALNTWGVLNTFGIFQTYYESGALFTETSSSIAWIGSIQALCIVSLGLVSGPLYDRGYLLALLLVGSSMIVFSFMMLSISTTFWEALLAQGFCFGIGAGLIWVPMLAVIPAYFRNKLGLAVGLAISGSSTGGVIYPIVFYNLIDSIGFGWTVRTLGFIALGTLLVPVCFLRMRVKPAKPRALLDWSAFTDWPFAIFVFCTMLGFIGNYVTLFFISYFSEATHIASKKMAFYLIPILNAGSVFGRTIPNAISDYTGPISIFIPAAIVCGILTLSMMAVTNLGGVVTIALLYGFFSGVFIALPSVCFINLTADRTKIGTRIGMGYAFTIIAGLVGGPGGGAIIGNDITDLHWNSLWIFGGVTTLAGAVLLIVLRFWITKGKFFVKL